MEIVQSAEELNAFYATSDPWQYAETPDDTRRKNEILSLLPRKQWGRVLDIGCGNGFLTFDLPGREVVGVDISEKAIEWAKLNRKKRSDADRFRFTESSLFELPQANLDKFDLIVVTGVLYPQYIGRSFSTVTEVIDGLLADGGVLASCHIDEWKPPRFPYPILDIVLYPYREHYHRLEIYKK